MPSVYAARDIADAHLVAAYLEANGVAAQVEGEALAMAIGSLPFGPTTGPSVHVADADVERALELIHHRPTLVAPTHCHKCGYDLTGLTEPRCPECGSPFDRPSPAAAGPWKCPKCGEEIEGQFTECWNCGTARDTAA